MCGFLILFLYGTVPLIARVAVRFVTSSSLEVVTCLSTNGGRDVLRCYVCELGDVMHQMVVCVLTASICVVFLEGSLICCLQTVCGVTEKHGYRLAGYHKLYQLCTDCLE